ncbi:DNA helicase [Microbacterium sp. YY-01]|uniref:DNA helicase n=1 Tax=Microbacterium sp. YY-01 TaxID=3421634 RepID=UPI003D169971
MGLSRKRKKELRRLQNDANRLWESQQVLVNDAANVARAASRQLGNFGREQVVPAVQDVYDHRVAPVVERSRKVTRNVVDNRVVPAVGTLMGTAMSAWDVANQKRRAMAQGSRFVPARFVPEPEPKKRGLGSVIAIVLGVAAGVGVLYAAWQALRTDDELWVADDPLGNPEA